MKPDAKLDFLGLEAPLNQLESARYHVIPAPYECTVSYGGGTGDGPRALLEASYQVELFDGRSVPAKAGIYTDSPLPLAGLQPPDAVARIRQAVTEVLKAGRVPILLGGEHTVTVGPAEAVRDVLGAEVGIVQFDAHGDLRNEYEGTPYSHACVMRRIVDMGLPIFQIGVRSLCEEEAALRRERRIPYVDAAVLARRGLPDPLLPADFPKRIYITFDLDALDPSLLPGTGTPEPGGLFWHDALAALAAVIRGRTVVGFDAVELAPTPSSHVSQFVAARLVYEIIGLIERLT